MRNPKEHNYAQGLLKWNSTITIQLSFFFTLSFCISTCDVWLIDGMALRKMGKGKQPQ